MPQTALKTLNLPWFFNICNSETVPDAVPRALPCKTQREAVNWFALGLNPPHKKGLNGWLNGQRAFSLPVHSHISISWRLLYFYNTAIALIFPFSPFGSVYRILTYFTTFFLPSHSFHYSP